MVDFNSLQKSFEGIVRCVKQEDKENRLANLYLYIVAGVLTLGSSLIMSTSNTVLTAAIMTGVCVIRSSVREIKLARKKNAALGAMSFLSFISSPNRQPEEIISYLERNEYQLRHISNELTAEIWPKVRERLAESLKSPEFIAESLLRYPKAAPFFKKNMILPP